MDDNHSPITGAQQLECKCVSF